MTGGFFCGKRLDGKRVHVYNSFHGLGNRNPAVEAAGNPKKKGGDEND